MVPFAKGTSTPLCLRRMTMELRHLRCFLAIAEEGTLTRAATRLHLTQPVVSRTLRQLEDHLGVRLIDRSTHHLGLTAAGHSFRIRAASAVAAADAAFDPAQLGVWPLRLGHAWSAFGEFTVSLLRSWLQEHPDVPLELRRIEDRTAGLARGEVDAALLRGPVTTPGIRTEPLMMEPQLAAVPDGTPLAARSQLTLAWIHPPTHPAIAKLVTLAREVVGYRTPGAT
jgi:DNA-binding transcriptional LysR family regulator